MTGPLPNDVDDAVRTLLALPADNWQPHHWDALDAVRSVLGDWVAKWDRAAMAKQRPRLTVQMEPNPSLDRIDPADFVNVHPA